MVWLPYVASNLPATGAVMSLEVELKFLLPAGAGVEASQDGTDSQAESMPARLFSQLQSQAGGQWQAKPRQRLLNAYFDTADSWFRRQDSGLRTRQQNQHFEQTIKLAGQAHGAAHIRPEYNLPCTGVLPELSAFPADIWPAGTDVSQLQQQLVELFRTDFDRQAYVVTLGQSRFELVCDIGVVSAAGQHEAIAEIELELQSGRLTDMLQLAQQLLQAAPLLLGVQSKAERGYRLAQARPLQPQQFTSDLTASAALRGFLLNQILHSKAVLTTDALDVYWKQWQHDLLSQQHPLASQMAQALTPTQRQLWLLAFTASLIDPATGV
jgi:triphosphatase